MLPNLSGPARRVAALLAAGLLAGRAHAAVVTWTENAVTNSLPTQWLQTNNWSANAVPTNVDIATFGAAGTNTTVTIQMATARGLQTVGEVALSSADTVNRQIYNNSTTSNGVLVVYGVNGVLAENSSASSVLFFDESAPSKPMWLGLTNSGQFEVDNAAAEISIYSVMTNWGAQPAGYSKTGPGLLFLHATNVYAGPTTNLAGTIELDAGGTFSTNTLYFGGGSFLFANDRSGAPPFPNPVVMTADTLIESTSGTANSTRTEPFSGNWSGSGNTLTIANLINNGSLNTFLLRLQGGFNFGENIVIGSANDTSGAYAVLQLYNAATNGTQTFSGTISSLTPSPGSGYVLRNGSSASAGGTSIFTGNNTYSGGTYISYGTLLADNTAGSALGSALGSGQVTVTNVGVLGGNGSVVAVTHVGVELPGGVVAPGSLATNIGNLSISDLTFGPGSTYDWQISAAAANPGVNQDLLTCATQWSDDGNSATPITIKVDSSGLVPTGWNSASAYDWTIIESPQANGFNVGDFKIDTSAFGGAIVGGFGLYVDATGDLHLTYTPGYPLVINVPSGSQSQETAGYPVLSGPTNIVKVGNGELILDNSANTYSGLTTILGGTVSLAANALSGSGVLGDNSSTTLLGNTIGSTNAALNIDQPGVTDAHNIQVQGGSSGAMTVETTINGGTATYSGSIALGTNVTLSAAPGGTADFAGGISGTGGVTLTGGGAIVLSGAATYSGPTTAGNVSLDLNAPALGTNLFTIGSGVTLDNTSGGNVTLASCPQAWNADFTFTGSANLNLGAGAVTISTNRTLTLDGSVLTVAGAISGPGSLSVTGPGTLYLDSATTNGYTGATTNAAGLIEIDASATFGNGAGPLVFAGGNLLNTSSRLSIPLINPVVLAANARIYGNGTLTGTSEYRYLPFMGAFTAAPGAALYVDNLGVSGNYFDVRLESTNGGANYASINFPIVVGDPSFDTAGAFEELDLANDSTTPPSFVNSVISGSGIVSRATMPGGVLNTGGTTVFMQQNTFSGGVLFNSGAIGFGCSSVSSGGVVQSGPVGTGTLTIGNLNAETAFQLFAYGGPQTVDNFIFLNGCTNILVTGTNNLTFTGTVDMGGIAKNWDVEGTGIMSLSGPITNSLTGAGGFTKSGPGTLVFSGNNLYLGQTIVNAGTLLVDSMVGSGTGTNLVDVAGGTLGGDGTIGGSVLFGPGAEALVTNGAPLTIEGNLTLNGNTFVVDLAGKTLGASTNTLINYAGSLSGVFSSTAIITDGSLASGYAATIDLSTPNEVNLIIAPGGPATPPSIASLTSTGTQLTLTGTNGTPGATYYVIEATNLLQSITTWTPIATNTFSSGGNFTNSISINPSAPRSFFEIEVP